MAAGGVAKLAATADCEENAMGRISKLALLALACAAVLTACNTVKGVGKDVQKAGEAIEGAAK